uniref:Pyrroline-5-carboxylate reductase n=1 Tax=Craspedostauros australis TaxID=1486917 RepID=A0A7R9ZS92_9STRA|eukprot:CAMPEP_0198109720 /NCGR_PEP_ID=MMETSP1442-20131203/1774_1 /TAXON_ID= /ORGANISM="Craspedostauros australis, Strain CCMP3328" /LENGTH=283 /DNA_ID=CAMNT_0043765503 /DNA_START=68 /DNA_END=919 /DNA_ORIENTATION=-
MKDDLSIGFVGCGMMASALMDGLIDKKVVKEPSRIITSDVYQPALDRAAGKGIATTTDNAKLCADAKDAIILAVKPNIIPEVCPIIGGAVDSQGALIISIAAGVTLQTLESLLAGSRVVRVMPNTPCLVGEAASAYAMSSACTEDDKTIVEAIFGAVGLCVQVKEELLNPVTGLSGSGPAYVYQFIEALADGGVRSGLPRSIALKLAAQTVKGAAEMVLTTGTHPGQLKDNVCSPGGTTIAGVEALENGGLRSATISAVKAATKRSMQLGGYSEDQIANKHDL